MNFLKKPPLLHLAVLLIFLSGVFSILQAGKHLETSSSRHNPLTAEADVSAKAASGSLPDSQPQPHPLLLLLVQAIVILTASLFFSSAFRRAGQPGVMGEIAAGLFLGPSLLGAVFPGYLEAVFPSSSLPHLKILGQVGVIIFMFQMGTQIDAAQLKKHARSAVLISQTGIFFPFLLGSLLAYFLYTGYAPANTSFSAFCLFLGIAMSITAFPVLAKILAEKKLSATPLGTTVLSCAAADDVTAWTLLAGITAAVKSESFWVFFKTGALSVFFVAAMIKGVKPFLAKRYAAGGHTPAFLSAVLFLVTASAILTEAIGIHALFGAFLAGSILPAEPRLREVLRERTIPVSHALLPLFFAVSGLKTQAGLIQTPEEWAVCGLIVAVSVLGKLGGTAGAAKISGLPWRESLTIGALMNARGLMELIVLNIGLDLGILSPRIFAMMVLMALVTTLMTGPLVDLFQKPSKKPD